MENLNDLTYLLDKFSRLPQLEIVPLTFMEIAGFPHYENVCSNILGYYLDANQPHKLKTLVLKSLLQAIEFDELSRTVNSVSSVQREEATPNCKRIDLVICAENVVIGIENKVYASLYNDLNEYSSHLNKEYNHVENIIKIVLSLNPVRKELLTNGFINLTYNTLFDRIKRNLGEYYLSANHKDITYLMDFILTIQNLNKMTEINPETIKFFTKNKAEIERLLEANNDIKTLIFQKIHQLKSGIEIPSNANQWIWEKRDLVHDFTFPDVTVAVDCFIGVEGITIVIWIRKGKVNQLEFLNTLAIFKTNPLKSFLKTDNRIDLYKCEDLPFDTPINEVVTILNNVLKQVYIIE